MNTLIVGSGFVGRALARGLIASGDRAVLASRTPPQSAADDDLSSHWVRLDITEPNAFPRVLDRSGADSVVLVHGPSDVTWCEQHPDEAMAGHAGAARLVTEAVDGRRTVLISTDNVFDGTTEAPDESAPARPANAYGRAKRAAEEILAEAAGTAVLRVSLIYGWEPADTTKWLNFFSSCVHGLRAGRRIRVPFDQWTTPVLIDDVVRVTAALTGAVAVPSLVHLGGPERISRADWAAVIAEEVGAPADLVVPEPRAHGRYAARPASTCLSSTLLAHHPATAGLALHGVRAAAGLLLGRASSSPSPTSRSAV